MKKVPQPHGKRLKPVKIYLDDLEEIIDCLKNTCQEIEIQSGENLLDDLDELPALNKEVLHDLRITGRKPYISVDMKPHQIWLYIAEDIPKSRGLFEKIKATLCRRRRLLAPLLHNSFLVGVSLSLTIWGLIIGLKMQSAFLVSLFGVFLLLCVFWGIYGFKDQTQQYTVIIPKYRIESPGFMKRNRDNIILAVISALIGALMTYILTYILR